MESLEAESIEVEMGGMKQAGYRDTLSEPFGNFWNFFSEVKKWYQDNPINKANICDIAIPGNFAAVLIPPSRGHQRATNQNPVVFVF